MSYQVFVDAQLLWDPYDDNDVVSSASISQAVNAAAYLDMEITSSNVPINEGSSSIEVRWESKTLFYGRVTDVSRGIDGSWQVSAVSNIDRLNDVLVRPHSTSGDVGEQVTSTLGGYFSWLVEQYNERAVGGYRIDVRVNQGDELHEGSLSVSEDGWPTVAAAIQDGVLSYGGYLDFIPYSGGADIDFYADIHDANLQIVDLGENITDITVKRSSEGQRTVLVPYGSDDDGNSYDLTSATSADLQLVRNAGYSVLGDAIYDPEYVAEYGYREERREFPGVTSVAELLREAVPYLRTMVAPRLTVECRAVDMALYREGYEHLRVGQAVRVRSEPHGVDEYLAVQDMELDLLDPSQTAYTLGVSYDTLTGQQSAFLRGLNGSIDHALDVVSGVEDTVSRVVNDANTDYYLSDSPDEPVGGEWGTANVTPLDNKYVFSRPHNTLVDGTEVVGEPTLVTPAARRSLKLHRDVGESPVWVAFVAADSNASDDSAQGLCRISGQMGGWDASEQGAVTVCFGLQDSAYAGDGLAGVGVVTEKSPGIDTSMVTIQAYESQGRVGVYVMLTGKVTVSLYAEGDGFSTPFVEQSTQPSGTKVFDLADVQTTYESAILQADNAIRAYVAATYATQGALGEVESTFDMRADQIQAQVEEKMDTAVAEIKFTEKSTFNQFSDSISAEVEQVRETADATATKAAELEVSLDGVTTSVSEAVETAEGAMTKATTVEQTVDGISSTVTGLDGRVSKVEQDTSGFEVTLGQVQGTANSALDRASALYGRCYTSAATKAKTVSIAGFELFTGATVQVLFSYANTAASPTLNVSSTGAKTIRAYNTSLASSSPYGWKANSLVTFTYNGTYWLMADSGALSRADDAMGEAEAASGAAADAAKTATNYLRFDSSGLCVGNMTGTLGYNALITSSQYQIRNGSTVLSSFGASSVSLGQNSTSSTISLCGGVGRMRAGTGTAFAIDSASRPLYIGNASQSTEIYGSAVSIMNHENSLNNVVVQSSSVSISGHTYTPVCRLNNPYSPNTKIWTADVNEHNSLINVGWTSEGIGWWAFA